jgi:hypothetical protein
MESKSHQCSKECRGSRFLALHLVLMVVTEAEVAKRKIYPTTERQMDKVGRKEIAHALHSAVVIEGKLLSGDAVRNTGRL